MIAAVQFAQAWALWALLGLPLLWWVLRLLPPRPRHVVFPAARLVLGQEQAERERDAMPLWLMVLRMAIAALLIIAAAGPRWHPDASSAPSQPMVILMDGGWAAGADWQAHLAMADRLLAQAAVEGRAAQVWHLARGDHTDLAPADTLRPIIAAWAPAPWLPRIENAPDLGGADVIWLAGGVAWTGQDDLARGGDGARIWHAGNAMALAPLRPIDGGLRLMVWRRDAGDAADITIEGIGAGGVLFSKQVAFAKGAARASADLLLPQQVLARLSHARIRGQSGAGGVALWDAGRVPARIGVVRRPKAEANALLSDAHFLTTALAQEGDIIEGPMAMILRANPDVIFMPDQYVPPKSALAQDLESWVRGGGRLVRFAGHRVINAQGDDPLVPVRLHPNLRQLGGALGAQSDLAILPFAVDGVFAGILPARKIHVMKQVLAAPSPDLDRHVIARFEDGSALVSHRQLGQGEIVFFHVGATSDWSDLVLDGVFLEMVARLSVARGQSAPAPDAPWILAQHLDGFGVLQRAEVALSLAPDIAQTAPSGAAAPAGVYHAGDTRPIRDVVPQIEALRPATWPRTTTPLVADAAVRALAPFLLCAAMGLLALEALLSMGVAARRMAMVLMLVGAAPYVAEAQEGDIALGYIRSHDPALDALQEAGLHGLGEVLRLRSSVDLAPPVALDPEVDELAVFPLIYWPVTPQTAAISPTAAARLQSYLQYGGMVLFDTRDGDFGGDLGDDLGGDPAVRAALRDLGRALDLPDIAPVAPNHVVMRSFYLLEAAPGRFDDPMLWAEATRTPATNAPVAQNNDGVSPVLIGHNDWISAWAVDDAGRFVARIGVGISGEDQREMAYRFGVNLLMYALTGNYKSDQVHVRKLLERMK